jgi:hypothetical protein
MMGRHADGAFRMVGAIVMVMECLYQSSEKEDADYEIRQSFDHLYP